MVIYTYMGLVKINSSFQHIHLLTSHLLPPPPTHTLCSTQPTLLSLLLLLLIQRKQNLGCQKSSHLHICIVQLPHPARPLSH